MVVCAAPRGSPHEAHLPAPQHSACTKARLSGSHGNRRWPEGPPQSATQGEEAPLREHLQEVSSALTRAIHAPDAPRPPEESAAPSAFGRARRVRKQAEFQRIQASGKRVTTKHFILLVAAQPVPGVARLGLVVSRRVGGAVVRNRIKRLCRECFRLSRALLPDGVDLVVIPKRGAESMKLHEVQAEWGGAVSSLGRRATEALAEKRNQPHVSAGR
jgi:ribonuclease P protein component